MPGGIMRPGTWVILGAECDNQGMAGLADPCPPADDSLNHGSRSHLAAVCSRFQPQAFLPATLAGLGHPWSTAHRSGSMAAKPGMAARFAGGPGPNHIL